MIKLIARVDSVDWQEVEARLADTLASISRQTGGPIDVVICGQDRPQKLDCTYPVHFVKAPSRIRRIDGIDRQAKQRMALREIVRRFDGPAYLFFMDADDIAHPDLVEHVLSDANGKGYLIDRGWMWRLGSTDVVPLSQSSSGMPFHAMCGSCLVMAVDLDRKALALRVLVSLPRDHQVLAGHLADLGQAPDAVPFPAMIYIVGHADNASTRYSRDGPRRRLFQNHKLKESDARKVLQEFGLQD